MTDESASFAALGDRLAYTEEGSFDKKAKRYSFKVTPSTMADKTKISGELWCEKHTPFHELLRG